GKNAEKYNIIDNPRFAQIAASSAGLVVSDSHTVQIGDTQGMATLDFVDNTADLLIAFKYLKDTPVADKLAKQIYFLEEGDFSELHYDIYTENPESVVDELEALVSHVEQPKSNILTGYGLALLRGGERHEAISHTGANNSLRTFWMYGGWGSSSHHQRDSLNIGIEAFGLNLSPDNGYPEATGTDPNRVQWVETTLSHNSVTVDEKIQAQTLESADPLHYDGDGRVKLIDMRSEEAYPELDEYRRTLVTVEAPGDIAYAVDFFNVQGGSSHIYSFHAQSESAQTEGLTMVPQMKDGEYAGSYAGVDVPGFKQDPGTVDSSLFYPKGFTWLRNLDRAENPEGTFVVDFAITDYNKAISNNKNIHLRMTQLSDTGADFTEVTVADGYVPNKQVNKNLPRGIKYALVKREGENLKSLFTTVLEPYRGERYIKSITPVEVTPAPSTGEVKAVCVELTNGQKDYIVYSTDSSVRYNVGGVFDFQGFVGVYSVDKNGQNVYSYINDGTVIGDNAELTKEYTGTVAEFNKDYEYNNHITLNMQVDDATSLAGKTVRVENDGIQNGVYLIQSAEKLSDEQVKLNLGLVTTIRKYVDENDFTKGYVYNIKEGQTATIAIEHEEDYSPVFEALTSTPTVSAGSSLSIPIKAETELDGVTISYVGTSLPRGASINENTGVLTWKPDASQVGDNHVSVTARDSSGRESVCHFVITVYGSTTGGSSNDTQTDENENSPSGDTPPAGGSGGGGGGGGAAPTDKPDVDDESLLLEEKVPSEGEADEVEKPQFTDLGNHSWAADAINELAADGIIKGTSASTFSPKSNITRADFAILLVRAFNLTSENSENFADVSASDYFASELAIARNTGIVNGIGDNKFAPRNSITRQDMMVIVYRALSSLHLEGSEAQPNVGAAMNDSPVDYQNRDVTEPQRDGDRRMAVDEVLSQYPDFDTVASYARDAVSALISAGLVNGKSGLIAPLAYTTRAEVAVLIKRILDYVK
ncbi:MAG: S-layer homology domain-containing protein, partial [Oscillospiraceae bacterium]|nr:S-layer homology domain-containing protein [Oscillospiraceae bacterium]